MKTMKRNKELIRVKDADAPKKEAEGYHYVPKRVWKRAIGDSKMRTAQEKQ